MQTPLSFARSAPAAVRNRDLILDVLRPALPARGTILEIASGTGEHITHFAREVPHLDWQPSDPDPIARASIAAWSEAEKLNNARAPINLDVRERPWSVAAANAILCINMVHISPWSASEALMAEAGRLLPKGGLLYLYGPYIQPGLQTAPSNIAFDADLRQRNAEWGLRNLAMIGQLANASGLTLGAVVAMPANNLSVLFRRK